MGDESSEAHHETKGEVSFAPLSLAGRRAIVSGGSRGIGAATVRLLVHSGARVVFSYERAVSAAAALVEELGTDRCTALQASLDDAARGEDLVARAEPVLGGLDVLVANHGIWPPADVPIDALGPERWRRTLAVNLDSVFGLVRAAVRAMRRAGQGGRIVLVSSTAGQRGEAFHGDYAASKGALISLTKGLSTELASSGILVNCVAPGWVDTDMAASTLLDPGRSAEVLRTIPLGRVGRPEEIAGPIAFLCSDLAGFITGEILNVNGGAVLVG